MKVFDNSTRFSILGEDLHLFSSNTSYGWQTVAEFHSNYYYLGDQYINVETAINCWQEINGFQLTAEEIQYIVDENDDIFNKSL